MTFVEEWVVIHTHTLLDISSWTISSFSPFSWSLQKQHKKGQPITMNVKCEKLTVFLPSLTLFSCSSWSRLLWEPFVCLVSSDEGTILPPDMLTPAAHHSWGTDGQFVKYILLKKHKRSCYFTSTIWFATHAPSETCHSGPEVSGKLVLVGSSCFQTVHHLPPLKTKTSQKLTGHKLS